ncbi:RNA polymerase sigma-70 factor (ECF subfamily) [Streptomyces sp. B3I7]|uniref:sigma-70 family RNA polymerase sigma factor n=1 Tax=Streptomyces sp. B3I7 TaxID=3042269 RepID=UPI00277EA4E1|nr:sigma-70 family RNA polymerase sigma factor [Streptomyces sp. B3I7]MDQ0808358.1 RNA polymerase sigma-70 factor (ECF subfamily) [Streptomyces sp. B3I7]
MPDEGVVCRERQALVVGVRAWHARRKMTPEASLGSEKGVSAAYQKYGGELLGFARNELGDPQLAEEIVQEVFLRAWRSSGSFDSRRGSLRTWLYAIARNAIVDARRRRDVRPAVAPSQEMGRGDADDSVDAYDQLLARIELREALDRLSPEHRKVVVEVYFLGRTCADLAEELGIPASSARSRLYHGIRALRGILDENGWLAP